MIDIRGERLATLTLAESLQLASEIMGYGFYCTRVDLAVDHVEEGISLYERALSSCEAGELCRRRRYSPDPEFKADGTPLRKLLKLGKRDSEVCVRIYDKGLESGSRPEGEWERFEVEFKGSRARSVFVSLVQCTAAPLLIWELVIGSVDFRARSDRSELSRRPRSRWWEEYLGQAIPRPTNPAPSNSSLASWQEWFRESVAKKGKQIASILGVSADDYFASLLEGVEASVTITPATIDARAIASRAS